MSGADLAHNPARTTDRLRSRIARARRRSSSRESGDLGLDWDRFARPLHPVTPTDPPGPTVVLLNDTRDQVNFGAHVLVDGLVRVLSRSMPNATIRPIPSHWLMDTSSGFEAFVGNGTGMRQPQARFPAVADQFDTLGDDWMNGRGGRDAQVFLRRLEQADLVVLNGEGSIYRANQSAIRELFLAWLSKKRLGIPTVFVNGTVHLTGVVPILPAMIRRTFAVLDVVAVRESCSLRNLDEHVPGIDVRLFPDSAFVCSRNDSWASPAVRLVKEEIGDAPYFCFDPGAMPIDHRPPERSALFDLLCRLCDVVPQAVLVSSAPADRYMAKVAGSTRSIYVDEITTYREYMALVADAQFVVSGRYHNPILAAIMGCPSITLASSNHKVHGACEMLSGLIGSPFDGTHLRPQLDVLQQQAHRYVRDRTAIRDQLLELSAKHHNDVLELGDLVAEVLRSRSPDHQGHESDRTE